MIVGKRILIVEDEPIVAMLLEDMLAELGAEPLGPAPDVSQAMAILDVEHVDAAVLDVNLGHERSDPVAQRLTDRGTPFVIATGYGREGSRPDSTEVLTKPHRLDQLRGALSRAFAAAA